MSGLFFGNRDISVSITAAQRFNFGFLNKSLLITDEEDIAITKLNSTSATTELETLLKKEKSGTTGITNAGDVVTVTAHGLQNGDKIRFSVLAGAAPLAIDTDYFVIAKTDNTFQLALTLGGDAIVITTDSTAFTYARVLSDTAPKLISALDKFVGQVDVSGNSVLPEYVYIIGVKEADVTASVSLITAAIDAAKTSNDFYCLVPVFESVPFNTWFATWGNTNKRVAMIYTVTNAKTLTSAEKSVRICGIYDGAAAVEFKNAAWTGRTISSDKLVGFKWKKLSGVNVDTLTDGQVSSLEDKGWNGYRDVRGVGETTGSRTTQNTNAIADYIDTIILRDNIVYNVAAAIHDMFKSYEVIPMGDTGRAIVRKTIATALNYCGTVGLIDTFENGSYMFNVTIPPITSVMRTAREITGITFTFVPTIPMEKMTVTGQEILEWIEGGNA